jgi:DNA-binding winged helix-turn-helix (wHTH) protein
MPQPTVELGSAEFELAGWLVQPSRNRLCRGEMSVRLEPKMMDVLVTLAKRPGHVLSKDEIADAVWPNLFVTESVITRAIAGLRRALEDDARTPRFIETIAKRGYRLVALPTPLAAPTSASPPSTAPPSRSFPADAPTVPSAPPYAAGQWVRGERFYGRRALLAEVLDGPRNGVWMLGSRAIGKTSTLKQLALLAAGDGAGRYLPLFWDLQGCERSEDLDAGFGEALAEAEESLTAAGLAPGDLEAGDFLASLARLRRAARARGRTLLLLLDEAEELIAIQARSPSLLRKLRNALQAQEGVRTVLAASSRLWRLAEVDGDTSPFLHGFAPPVYLGPLDDAASRQVVRQSQAARGELDVAGEVVDRIVGQSGGHPYVLQLLATRYWQLGDLDAATEAVAADPGLHHLFAVDFGLLSAGEQELLATLAGTRPPHAVSVGDLPGKGGELAASLLHLDRLGIIRRDAAGVEIASSFLQSWLGTHRAPGA